MILEKRNNTNEQLFLWKKKVASTLNIPLLFDSDHAQEMGA